MITNQMSFQEIANELEKLGIKISTTTVSIICKKIYDLKGEE